MRRGFSLREFKLMDEPTRYVTLSSPLKVFFDITADCNLMCKFCYKEKSQVEVDMDRIIKILEKLSKAKVLEVIIAGGEPFRQIYVFEMAEKLGLRTGFISNGTLISKEIAKRIPSCVDGCSISFHGPNAEIYEKLTGVNGSFDDAVKGIKNLNSVGMSPGILYTPTKINQSQLFSTVEFLVNSGIDFSCIQVNRLIPEGKACQYWSELNVDHNGYEELLQQMFEVREKWPNIRVETGDAAPFCAFDEKYHDFIVRCNYGITIGGIDEFGNFSRCPCRHGKLGNLFKKTLKQIWLESKVLISHRNLDTIPEECKKCSLLEKCGGGCLCSLQDEKTCIDAYSEETNIKPIIRNLKDEYTRKKCTKLPNVPIMNLNYAIRIENKRLLCIPIGVQEVFHDTVVPHNNEFPLLWIDDTEREILRLVNGERSIEEICRGISSEFKMDYSTGMDVVKKTLALYITYNYIKKA